MSFDLMVFDASAAPSTRKEFLAWYDEQTQWQESHGYNNPDIPAPALQAWFREMIKTYPPMNGPLASDDDDPTVTDYSLGRSVIYAAFAWSQAEAAWKLVWKLAETHGVGFRDVSADDNIWFPTASGKLEKLKK